MEIHEAVALIEHAVPEHGGIWADFGAGDGTFTRALAELLGPDATIYAVDTDRHALDALVRASRSESVTVRPIAGDFRRSITFPELNGRPLDGMLFANSLHFVPDPGEVLARLVTMLRPGGRVAVVEYDRRARSRWVPHPISPARLAQVAAVAGLSSPRVIARMESTFGGELYAAVSERLTPTSRS